MPGPGFTNSNRYKTSTFLNLRLTKHKYPPYIYYTRHRNALTNNALETRKFFCDEVVFEADLNHTVGITSEKQTTFF